MKPEITFKRIWQDDDMVELEISTCDGKSIFESSAYIGHSNLAEISKEIDAFKDHLYGGLYDLRIGEFGPEYANGAFHARMEFHRSGNGKLSITVKSESEWEEFTHTKVASNSTLFLRTEPALLDNFILSFKGLSTSTTDEASLQCI